MLALHQIYPHLQKGDWMFSIDLQDAYFHVPITPRHRKFLHFMVGTKHYQYKVLPFGLKSAPRVFTKCMAVVAAVLRLQGLFVYPYLDDWLLKGSSQMVKDHYQICLNLLQRLGLHVNMEKSIHQPTQRIHYLGAALDSSVGKVFPSERLLSIQQKCSLLLQVHQHSVRQVASLLGSMASCIFLVPNSRLRMRPLEQDLEDKWDHTLARWEDRILLSKSAKASIPWWSHRRNLLVEVPFHQPPPTQSLITDASLQGWGVHLGLLQKQGGWLIKEQW